MKTEITPVYLILLNYAFVDSLPPLKHHLFLSTKWRFCGSSTAINIYPERITLYMKLARMKEEVPLTSYLAACRGRQVLALLPHHMQNFSHHQYPPVIWNHDEKREEGTSSVTGYRFFNTHLVYKRIDLHVKSWCIMKTCTLVKENLYWTNLISIFGNFKSPRNIAENSFMWILKKIIESKSAIDCSYWENFYVTLVFWMHYLPSSYLGNFLKNVQNGR